MNYPNEFIQSIKDFEGFRKIAYFCPSGKYTIGYGHTGDVKPNDKITEEVATRLLINDLDIVAKQLSYFSWWHDLPHHQQLAFVDLVFNIGIGNFKKSSFDRRIKTYLGTQLEEMIAVHFLAFNKSGGKELAGLTKRRYFDYNLFRYGKYISIFLDTRSLDKLRISQAK